MFHPKKLWVHKAIKSDERRATLDFWLFAGTPAKKYQLL